MWGLGRSCKDLLKPADERMTSATVPLTAPSSALGASRMGARACKHTSEREGEGTGEWGRGGGGKKGSEMGTHLFDPVDVRGHAGEDRGLLDSVAAQRGAEADDALHLPETALSLAVQWAAGVPLCQTRRSSAMGLPPQAGLGSRGRGGGWSQWGIWAGAPYFGLSLSMVREAEEMRFGGARLACRLLCDLGLMITLSVPQFP